MSAGMHQDGEGLKRDAEAIREAASRYKQKIEDLYTEVNNTVSASDEGKAWYGPKAGEFVQAVESLRGDFEKIATALNEAADNLSAQADAWSQFES